MAGRFARKFQIEKPVTRSPRESAFCFLCLAFSLPFFYFDLNGMITLADKTAEQVGATDVRFVDNVLFVSLSDGREISVPMERVEWLSWLNKAAPAQRSRWSLEPNGFAIYWEDLDDGIEVRHLLEMQPLV